MAILIENMEMPKEGEWISVNIFHDGKCFLQSWCGKDFNFAAKLTAVPVPPHGRLIDANELIELCNIMADKCGDVNESIWNQFRTTVECVPIIIPAEEAE